MIHNRPVDNSGELFDYIMNKNGLLRDCQFAEFIGEHKSVISQIRNGKRQVNDGLLARICEKSKITIKMAREKIGAGK